MATKEELIENRKKMMATIKASNQMLEDAKRAAMKNGADKSVIKQIENAQDENLRYAQNTFGASQDEIESSRYHGASIYHVKGYQKHLKARGLTDEQVHQKEMAMISNDTEASPFENNKRDTIGIGKAENNESLPEVEQLTEGKEKPAEEAPVKKRRTRKKKAEQTVNDNETELTPIKIKVSPDKSIPEEKPEPVEIKEEKKKEKPKTNAVKVEDFNLNEIPDYVQYDIIPLPSNGECYPHKKGRIPVAYLTASDENLIASPNMYRDGNLLDVILRRKILDKSINVDELCSGDRDAIVLWLRATAYGDEFPIVATHPDTRKQYNINVPLSSFKYYDFNLKGNENGFFEYKTERGDVLEFKFLTKTDEEELRKKITEQAIESNRLSALKSLTDMRESINGISEISEENRKNIDEDIEEILEIIGSDIPTTENLTSSITDQMILHTVSVNGNSDPEYVKNYIENMRSMEAISYRKYFTENKPGVDFTIKVNVPESDGGGSFETFLRYDDTIFINF